MPCHFVTHNQPALNIDVITLGITTIGFKSTHNDNLYDLDDNDLDDEEGMLYLLNFV